MKPTIRRRWKQAELAIARLLGGERVPVSGRTRGYAPDIKHDWLSIEVKERKNHPIYLVDAMDQAEKAAMWYKRRGEGERLPIAVLHKVGANFSNDFVVMRLGNFLAYFGDQLPQEEESEHERTEAESSGDH